MPGAMLQLPTCQKYRYEYILRRSLQNGCVETETETGTGRGTSIGTGTGTGTGTAQAQVTYY